MGKLIGATLAFLTVFVVTVSVEALTNGELYEIITENTVNTDAIDDATTDDIKVDDDKVSVYFPGDEQDDVALDHLISQLGFQDQYIDDIVQDADRLVGGCSCSKTRCSCCTSKTFSARIMWKKVKARLSTCITIEYLNSDFGVRLTFVVNGRTMCRKEFSLRNPPGICYKVPGLGKFARVCAEIYDVNLARRSFCIRVAGVIDLKVKKWRFRIKLACLRIPRADYEQLEVINGDAVQMTSHTNLLPVIGENAAE